MDEISFEAFEQIAADITPTTIDLVERGRAHTSRIVEFIDVRGDRVQRRVLREMRLPNPIGDTRRVLVPMFRRRKGHLLDNFDLVQPTDAFTTLAFVESQRFGTIVLYAALLEELEARPEVTWNEDTVNRLLSIPFLSAEAAKAEYHGLFEALEDPTANANVARNALVAAASVGDEAAVVAAASAVITQHNQTEFRDWLFHNSRLRELAAFFVCHYYVVARVEPAHPPFIHLHYAYDSDPGDSPSNHGRIRSSLASFGEALGKRPSSFMLGVPLALETNSYHLRMPAPHGHYVDELVLYRAQPREPFSTQIANAGLYDPSADQARVMGTEKRKGPAAHVYLHDVGAQQQNFLLYLHAVFLEQPPTIALPGLVVSLLTTVPLLLLAGILNPLTPHPVLLVLLDQGAATDIVAIALMLPAAAALWMRGFGDEVDLVRTQLLARVMPILSGFLSLLAALSFLVYRSQLQYDDSRYLDGRDQAWWISLAAASGLISLYLFGRLVRMWLRYATGK